jgi:hypothetical protein
MSESRKKIVSATVVAVMLVALLGFLSYRFFPQFKVQTPFAFGWLEGKQERTNNTITLLISTLSPGFTFQNETAWWQEQWALKTYGIPENQSITLQGEHNATWLKLMSIHPYNIICTPADLPFDGTYHITATINTTIHVSLEAVTNVDLGVYDCWNESYIVFQNDTHSETSSIGEPAWNISGYWAPKDRSIDWEIDVEKLSGMLQGSGTALITFQGALRVDLDYQITMNGVETTNEKNLSWEGTMGTIKITYDQGRIIWVEHELHAIDLTMLTTSE